VPVAGRSATGCRQTSVATPDRGHLEGDVAAMTDDLGADLDRLLLEAAQRPRLRRRGQRQRPHEVAKIVGQRMELETHRVGGEGLA
jgi:hypothetical protein